ncbi:MAG: glycosyltransferase family 4 protein, partial [Clostridium sp.]|nr:glycosyltransferase family 4 protein [Clostridium sp.]
DKVNLLFVGRFDPQKGVDFLLKVFKDYEEDLQHIHLWIIGDNVVSDGKGIEKKNTDNITFLGWIPHEELTAYYEACDAVIMPSRWEAFGLVAIEAMKYGKPVIVSNRGALPELVKEGVNGWIFDMDEYQACSYILKNITKGSFSVRSIAEYFYKYFDASKMLNETSKVMK